MSCALGKLWEIVQLAMNAGDREILQKKACLQNSQKNDVVFYKLNRGKLLKFYERQIIIHMLNCVHRDNFGYLFVSRFL